MSTWLHHRLGFWPITRAPTGCSSSRPRARSRSSRPRSCWFSRAAAAPVTACSRRLLRSALSSLTWPLARVGAPAPADEVAHGLERAARPLLDRRDDLDPAALHGVQPAAGGLAE